ncbi:MAG: hypothetical protein KKH32_06545 [Bacteroidetes bacterium]|nr:hypothetical protein [Bacteroidota bacterium]
MYRDFNHYFENDVIKAFNKSALRTGLGMKTNPISSICSFNPLNGLGLGEVADF